MGVKGMLVMIVTTGVLFAVPGSQGESAAERGNILGTALLEFIQLQAKTRMWDSSACEKYPLAPEVKEVCSAFNRFSDLFLEFGEDRQDDAASQEHYMHTLETNLLAALQAGISDRDAFIRFQTLAVLEALCRSSVISPANQSHCGAESERSALRILSEDASPLNRHLALQILAGGRATVQSREILGEIAKTARAGEGECPEILPVPDSSDKPIPITELSERFESGIYFCEGALAAKALAAIKDAN